VSTADLAVIGITVLGLANVARDYRVQMRVADRVRLVNPVKAPVPPMAEADTAATVEELSKRRPA